MLALLRERSSFKPNPTKRTATQDFRSTEHIAQPSKMPMVFPESSFHREVRLQQEVTICFVCSPSPLSEAMQISVVQPTNESVPSAGDNLLAKVKKDFEALGSALDSGNLDEAKNAFSQLQKDATSQDGKNDPVSDAIESLGTALDSGDLKSAQEDYAEIKKAMTQEPPPGRPDGQPGGDRGAKGAPPAGGSSTSNKTYDPKDTNKDGTVAEEEFEYDLAHPQEVRTKESESPTADSTANDAAGGMIDIQA